MSKGDIQKDSMIVFEGTLKDQKNSPINISTASVREIVFINPMGDKEVKDAVLTNGGADGKQEHERACDKAGKWSYQHHVKIGTKDLYSDIEVFNVRENL